MIAVTRHIVATLQALEAGAITDHRDLEADGAIRAAEAMAERADLYRQLAAITTLLGTDPEFARTVSAAIVADAARGRQALEESLAGWERELLERTDTEDLTADELETLTDGWAEEAAAEEAQLEVDTDPRTAALADARRLLDFLQSLPGVPFRQLEIMRSTSAGAKDDAAARAEVDRVAALLGVEAGHAYPGAHYEASKTIGSAEYRVFMVTTADSKRWDDQLRLGEAALAVIEPDQTSDGPAAADGNTPPTPATGDAP